jgi:hypothetical protein
MRPVSTTFVCASVMAVAVLAVSAPEARAATARVEVREAPGGPLAKLIYEAAPGEANWIWVCATAGSESHRCTDAPPPARPPGYVIGFDTGLSAGTVPGPGCEPGERPNEIHCPLPAGTRATGPLIELGDRRDRVSLFPTTAFEAGAVLRGGGGSDRIHANAGLLDGGAGNDMLGPSGYVGPKRWSRQLRGGSGADSITAGPGPDLIEPGSGRDTVKAGAGADRIRARDREFDDIRCGDGVDRLWLDGIDLAVGRACERIRRRGRPRAIPFDPDVEPDSDFGGISVDVACPTDMPRDCRTVVLFTIRGGRRVGQDRLRLRPGQTKVAGIVPTDAALSRRVWSTARTLRQHAPPLVSAPLFVGVWSEYVGDG